MKILTPTLLLALVAPACADIITLKDGSKLNATILEKTLEDYELEVNVTNSIKERRTVKRADVVDIEKVNESQKMFEEKISALLPVPPFSPLEEYDKRIATMNLFLQEHKEARVAQRKTQKLLEEITEERAFIKSGGVKVNLLESGRISEDERLSNSLEIESQILAAQFQNLVEARSYLAAVRQYDLLEEQFYGTQAHRDSSELMQRLISTYVVLLKQELAELPDRNDRRAASLDRLPPSEKDHAMVAEKQRMTRLEQIHEKEETEGERWLTVDLQSEASLENTINALMRKSEQITEDADALEALPEAGELYRKGWIAAGAKQQEELETILDQMDEIPVSENYINALVDRFDPTINGPTEEEKAAMMKEKEKMMGDKEMMDDKMSKEEMMEKEKMEDK